MLLKPLRVEGDMFKQNLIHARSHIIFLVGLAIAFGLVVKLENWKLERSGTQSYTQIEKSATVDVAKNRELSPIELGWAKTAWAYFENNTQESTGLVNSVDAYESSTLWDTSSYLMGLISAYRLGLIDEAEFDGRMSKVLGTLADLDLFDGALPNKAYNTRTAKMTTYTNEVTERGIGWSAIDIARLMVPMNIIVWNYPKHVTAVKDIVASWDFDAMLRDGTMYGTQVNEQGETELVQEGRLGYEEYAAKSLVLMGMDASQALEYFDNVLFIEIFGEKIATDSRDPERFQAHNYIVSEPYVLDGIEFGWDQTSKELAARVFKVQRLRYEDSGVLTAVSEDNIDQAPWFVYNTVFTDGKTWNAITDTGEDASAFRTLSTKAALGWHVLFDTEYTKELADAVMPLQDPKKGWYSGRYEASGKPNKALTANTNAVVLESLAYRRFGKLVAIYKNDSE